MTDTVLDLMDQRRMVKNIDSDKYHTLQKTIRNQIRQAKEQWLTTECREIEELEQKHDSFHLHKKVKQAAGVHNNDGLDITRDEIVKTLELVKTGKAPENPDVIPGAPYSIVILQPLNPNDAVTDEDPGDENEIALNNLPGSQLRAEAEVMYDNIFDDNVPTENISRTTSNNDLWDSEGELPLSSLVRDKRKRAGQSRISKTKEVSVTCELSPAITTS
ncbi:hypothetical protein RN001_010097 [Aquatica leii]|uniref:Uncharacterized protein n=1 Tax=Aquatica leii TaxID=1421715 RepID=A0AAN7S8F3_9COLE|nr:hypothetical protein RN001_010097 [Aquatica leii]